MRFVVSGPTTGSSPLTRGKPDALRARVRTGGLIPAHAGKTVGGKADVVDRRAHPRSRGENPSRGPRTRVAEGSSPLTRGKLTIAVTNQKGGGLIPAHAGKTRSHANHCTEGWAHPRSRGENSRRTHDSRPVSGSSPLTRGKQPARAEGSGGRRLIPAHAGKTLYSLVSLQMSRAHPRSRGENPVHPSRPLPERGSSPLTRGKR